MDLKDLGAAPNERNERDELELAIRLLDGVMQAEGVSPGEVDARLGRPAGATAALLALDGAAGEPERRQVLEILAALELEPEAFFRALYPEPPERGAPAEPAAPRPREPGSSPAPLFERIAAELAVAGYAPHPADEPADGGAPPDPEELERRVREAVRAALAAGDDLGRR